MRLGAARRSSVAPALALPFPALEKAGLRIRRGQSSLTVAAPGVGKSQLWANLAHRLKIPSLYWSADTSHEDVTLRTLALYTGKTVKEIEEQLKDDVWRKWMFDRLGDQADHIDWVFDSPITPAGLGARMKAFATIRGEWPWLAVIDNLGNAIQDPHDKGAEIEEFQNRVEELARQANCHVAVLHHAKGQYDDGVTPIPQSGGLHNPFKVPSVGLTLCRPGNDASGLHLYVVKNRGGISDPAARHPIYLNADLSRATIRG